MKCKTIHLLHNIIIIRVKDYYDFFLIQLLFTMITMILCNYIIMIGTFFLLLCTLVILLYSSAVKWFTDNICRNVFKMYFNIFLQKRESILFRFYFDFKEFSRFGIHLKCRYLITSVPS